MAISTGGISYEEMQRVLERKRREEAIMAQAISQYGAGGFGGTGEKYEVSYREGTGPLAKLNRRVFNSKNQAMEYGRELYRSQGISATIKSLGSWEPTQEELAKLGGWKNSTPCQECGNIEKDPINFGGEDVICKSCWKKKMKETLVYKQSTRSDKPKAGRVVVVKDVDQDITFGYEVMSKYTGSLTKLDEVYRQEEKIPGGKVLAEVRFDVENTVKKCEFCELWGDTDMLIDFGVRHICRVCYDKILKNSELNQDIVTFDFDNKDVEGQMLEYIRAYSRATPGMSRVQIENEVDSVLKKAKYEASMELIKQREKLKKIKRGTERRERIQTILFRSLDEAIKNSKLKHSYMTTTSPYLRTSGYYATPGSWSGVYASTGTGGSYGS